VSRVPGSGFDPPKYSTAYDALVDEELQALSDAILADEPALELVAATDLNTYVPSHNSIYCRDWTGDPASDLKGNRIKRFIGTAQVIRAARIGLGPDAGKLPELATRAEVERACLCPGGSGQGGGERAHERDFLVQTMARDTGAILTILAVPIYVRDRCWGASVLAWSPETVTGPAPW
jgi:hypothetical protein